MFDSDFKGGISKAFLLSFQSLKLNLIKVSKICYSFGKIEL